jgi:hypothetical protein
LSSFRCFWTTGCMRVPDPVFRSLLPGGVPGLVPALNGDRFICRFRGNRQPRKTGQRTKVAAREFPASHCSPCWHCRRSRRRRSRRACAGGAQTGGNGVSTRDQRRGPPRPPRCRGIPTAPGPPCGCWAHSHRSGGRPRRAGHPGPRARTPAGTPSSGTRASSRGDPGARLIPTAGCPRDSPVIQPRSAGMAQDSLPVDKPYERIL